MGMGAGTWISSLMMERGVDVAAQGAVDEQPGALRRIRPVNPS
jgi:hypothetical protein